MVVVVSGERVRSSFIMSHTCSVGERSGELAGQHEEHVASQQPYVGVSCPAEKAHHFPVEEMAVARG